MYEKKCGLQEIAIEILLKLDAFIYFKHADLFPPYLATCPQPLTRFKEAEGYIFYYLVFAVFYNFYAVLFSLGTGKGQMCLFLLLMF